MFVPLTNKNGCDTFTKSMFDAGAQDAIYNDKVAMELPVILIERGDCTFVTKVRNVEKAGANIALIGDNKEEDSEVFIMSDDGSGHSINIPSFLLDKRTSDAFEQSYQKGEHIIIQVKIETAQSANGATVDLWYSTPFDLSVRQLKDLRKTIPLFGDHIKLDLKVKTTSNVLEALGQKEKDCISNGLYCPISPLTKNEELIDFID